MNGLSGRRKNRRIEIEKENTAGSSVVVSIADTKKNTEDRMAAGQRNPE